MHQCHFLLWLSSLTQTFPFELQALAHGRAHASGGYLGSSPYFLHLTQSATSKKSLLLLDYLFGVLDPKARSPSLVTSVSQF